MFLLGSGSNGGTGVVSVATDTHTCGFVSHSDNASWSLHCLSGCSIIYLLPFPIHLGLRMPFIISKKPCVRYNLKTWWISKLVPPHCQTLPVLFTGTKTKSWDAVLHDPEWTPHKIRLYSLSLLSLAQNRKKRKTYSLTSKRLSLILKAFRPRSDFSYKSLKSLSTHDKTNSEMMVNRSFGICPALSLSPAHTISAVAQITCKTHCFSLIAFSCKLPHTLHCWPACQQALSKHSCPFNELQSAK